MDKREVMTPGVARIARGGGAREEGKVSSSVMFAGAPFFILHHFSLFWPPAEASAHKAYICVCHPHPV